MATQRLTTNRIETTKADPAKDVFLWDTAIPGFGLKVSKAGGKAYVFSYWHQGKKQRITLGDARLLPLDEARTKAKALAQQLDEGTDPKYVRDEAKEQRAVTVADILTAFVEAKREKASARYMSETAKMQQPGAPLHELLNVPAHTLTPSLLAAWLKRESASRPTYAGLAYRTLRAALNWSSEDFPGIVPAGLFAVASVKAAVPKSKARDDCLQREQLALWFSAVQGIQNPVISAYLQALLLTGARRTELLELRWDEVNLHWNALSLGGRKSPRQIPLTPYVKAILTALPKRNQWVFSSPDAKDGRMQDPHHAHNHALERAGLPHLTLHGLRRSFGTLAEWTDTPSGVIAQIQGHAPSAIAEKHYRRRPLDMLRQHLVRIESWILAEAGLPVVLQPISKQI